MTTPFPYGLSMLKVRNLTNVLQQKLQLGFRCLAICCFCSCVVFGGESFSEEKRVVTIGVLDSSLSATDKSAIAQTLEALENLPGYRLDVQYYNPSELEEQLIQKKLDYFIGTSGFYRRFQSFGLRSVATLFTETAPNPRYATGSVFVVEMTVPSKRSPNSKANRLSPLGQKASLLILRRWVKSLNKVLIRNLSLPLTKPTDRR